VGYATVVERNWFALRRYEVPILPPDTGPLRVLQISDTNLTPDCKRLMSWIRSLDGVDPHLVVNTGDSLAHPFLDSLGPRLDRPGAFVLGLSDRTHPYREIRLSIYGDRVPAGRDSRIRICRGRSFGMA
jgi:hypothetical protein